MILQPEIDKRWHLRDCALPLHLTCMYSYQVGFYTHTNLSLSWLYCNCIASHSHTFAKYYWHTAIIIPYTYNVCRLLSGRLLHTYAYWSFSYPFVLHRTHTLSSRFANYQCHVTINRNLRYHFIILSAYSHHFLPCFNIIYKFTNKYYCFNPRVSESSPIHDL